MLEEEEEEVVDATAAASPAVIRADGSVERDKEEKEKEEGYCVYVKWVVLYNGYVFYVLKAHYRASLPVEEEDGDDDAVGGVVLL